jgi:PAS domain-containing protein
LDQKPVAQHDLELILLRQLATHLAIPMFIVDATGALLFYNEAAESLLGRTYEENDEMPLEKWSVLFRPASADGSTIPPDELPLVIALSQRRPAFLSSIVLTGQDKVQRKISTAAFPVVGQQDRYLGAVALFWEV